MTSNQTRSQKPIVFRVCFVSPNDALAAQVRRAVASLASLASCADSTTPDAIRTTDPAPSALLNAMLARAKELFASMARVELRFTHWRAGSECVVTPPAVGGLCLVDNAALNGRDAGEQELDALAISSRLGGSPALVVLATTPVRYGWSGANDLRIQLSAPGKTLDLTGGDLTEHVTSRVLDTLEAQLVRGKDVSSSRLPVALATVVHRFMAERYFDDWTFLYLTGSPISAFVNDLEVLARAQGVPCLRGPSEHSLACGAFANWRLFQRPFVIAVTKGMLDEFRGTLSNLLQSRARGFIVAADDVPETWFGAQASITPDEDMRDVLRARRLHHVLFASPDAFEEDIASAFELFERDEGPVVLLATAQMLAHRVSAAVASRVPTYRTRSAGSTRPPPSDALEQNLERAVQILNIEPVHLLWQVGSTLQKKELRLLLSIAEKAGIALANGCISPGAVPHYHEGARVPHLLGGVGVYTFTRSYYDFLFEGGKPRPDQVLFFLKSKLSGAERPLSDAKLAADFRVVQVNRNAAHLAPFAELGLCMPLLAFLERMQARLDVAPRVRELRLQRLNALDASADQNIAEAEASLPMTTNYFMNRLGKLVDRLIREQTYDFIGVNGVSRVGFSMVRNVPLVRAGFSGIYGRGLMGDALCALGALAFMAGTNLLAVIGDGERNLVPDWMPALIENILHGNRPLTHNVTLFVGCNARYSMIETYLNLCGVGAATGNRQAANVNVLPADAEFTIAGVRIRQRLLTSFDEEWLASAIQEPACVNVFFMVLAHNDAGDGMTLASMRDWRYAGSASATPESH